ncbi:MAG: response regulator transcription factor [Chloroflexota bacterium]|nr:response regulator transcription factor [Chloroflexota bacterium]MDE2907914.1 response regulator transcription factor [Chloroflexota bacterium]
MSAGKILIIDDEQPAVDVISTLARQLDYEVYHALSGQQGLRIAYQQQPDLVMLDAVLPDRDGWAICRQLRDLADASIIFVSARTNKEDVIRGLELGADDYVTKPFDADVLLARIKACLRRSTKARQIAELVFDNGNFRINFLNRQVWIRNAVTHLTPKEFNLLAVLARNAGRVVTRADLVTQAWGEEYRDAVDSLKLYIHYLRQKLELNPQQPRYILTSRGVGYRFNED